MNEEVGQLEFDDFYEKKTQFILELHDELTQMYEETNSEELFATLDDLERAIEAADLTNIQRDCVRLYYFEGYMLQEISEIREVAWQTVQKSIKAAVKRIADVYREWRYWTEGESHVITMS